MTLIFRYDMLDSNLIYNIGVVFDDDPITEYPLQMDTKSSVKFINELNKQNEKTTKLKEENRMWKSYYLNGPLPYIKVLESELRKAQAKIKSLDITIVELENNNSCLIDFIDSLI